MAVDTVSTGNASRKSKILMGVFLLQGYVIATDLGIMLTIPRALQGHGKTEWYGILITLYILTMAIATPVGGKLGDLFGRKKAIMAGTLIFILGSIISGLSPNFIGYFIGFMIIGLGMGLMLSLPIAMISDVTTQKEFPKMMGFYTSVNNAGMLLGPIISGIITDKIGPSLVYVYLLPLGAFALWTIHKSYEEETISNKKPIIDYLGILFLTLGAGPILLLLNLAGSAFAWLSIPSIALFAIGIIFVYVFIKHEFKFEEPVIAVKLFKDRRVAMGFLRTLTFMAYSSIVTSYLILFAQDGINISATVSGTLALPKTFATIILPAVFGAWVAKDSSKRLKRALILAGTGVGVGCVILGIGSTTSIAVILIFVSMVFLGVGESFYFVSQLPQLKSMLPADQIGSGISINTFLSTFSLAVYGAIFGAVLNAFNNDIARAFPTMCFIGVFCAGLFIALSYFGVKKEEM